MTIGAWILFIILALVVIGGSIFLGWENDKKALCIFIGILICIGMFFGFRWYYTSTANGIRAVTDERSNLSNGLDRTINVYTADGTMLAHYEGKIDLEMDQDYIKFDWQGKRYIYYNCFVETIAVIP